MHCGCISERRFITEDLKRSYLKADLKRGAYLEQLAEQVPYIPLHDQTHMSIISLDHSRELKYACMYTQYTWYRTDTYIS